MPRIMIRRRHSTLIGVIGLLLISLVFSRPAPASGASFTVNSTLDLPDGNPGDGVCLTGPPFSACTLRAAIMESNALPGFDTINLSVDTYLLTRAAVIPDVEANGDLDITDDLTIQGVTSDLTVIDGNTVDRVLEINGSGVQVELFNLTVMNGAVSGEGGGIRTYLADVSLTNVKILNNQATSNGGGITSQGPLVLDNVTLQGNQAVTLGGGLYNILGATITNSVILGNQVTSSFGQGAGIYAVGDLEISGSVIQTNTSNGGGGGIAVESGTTTITDTTFDGNLAEQGGGVFGMDGSLSFDGVTLTANKAIGGTSNNSGGAVFFTGTGTLNLTNSTVSGNQADGDGGGIFLYEGSINLVNTTIAGNVADLDDIFGGDGGGVYNELGSLSLLNTILAGNTASISPNNAPDCYGILSSQGFNLVQILTADCTLTGTTTGNLTGSDPLLGPLADHGGPTLTHMPLSASPVIDAGTNAGCPATDQRGINRPIDGDLDGVADCDMGAYEKLIDLFLPLIMR